MQRRRKKQSPPQPCLVPIEHGEHDDEDLDDMLARLEITKWDWLLIGDGSGSNWGEKIGCGWGCVAIKRLDFSRTVFWGAMNQGTVNFAEMMAYLQALNCIAAAEDQRRKRVGRVRTRVIHIITDSEYCSKQGSSRDFEAKRNAALWRVFEDYQRRGLILHWHHVPRTTAALNNFVDAISKAARLWAKKCNIQKMLENGGGTDSRTVYDFNP